MSDLDHLQHNLEVLASRQPDLAAVLAETKLTRVQLAPSRTGAPTAFYTRDKCDPMPLHSRYDVLREARQSLSELDMVEADYFTFLGFGLGYGVDALLERISRDDAHVFVIESDLEILRAAFSARDLCPLLSLPHIHFAWPATGNELAGQWQRFFDPVHARRSIFVNHPPSLVIDPDLFKAAAEIIRSKTLQIFTDINTLVGRIPVFLDNFVANIARACRAPGVQAFAGRFPGVPAVLVAAGPSLDRNIQELYPCQKQVLILAADTALKPLLASRIEPHFVLSGDPGHENYLHLKGARVRETYLVAEATAYPETFAMFEGHTIVCKFENSSLAGLSDLIASKGTLRAWGSVATMCLDFALMMGCNPIIFAGQDLAYSEGRMYCSGLHWDERWFEDIHDPDAWRQRWAELRAHDKIVMTTDLFGEPVASTEKLMAYWNWIGAEIEKHPEVRFINGTEGGILKTGVEVLSLREALHRFRCPARDLSAEIRSLYQNSVNLASSPDWTVLTRLQAESTQLEHILKRGFSQCEKSSGLPAAEISARLENTKQAVYALKTLAPLLDRFNQMGNFRFLRHQASLSRQGAEPGEICDTYREFFNSVDEAAQIISNGLGHLFRAVAEPRG